MVLLTILLMANIIGVNMYMIINILIYPKYETMMGWRVHRLLTAADESVTRYEGISEKILFYIDDIPVVYDNESHKILEQRGIFCGKDSAASVNNPDSEDPRFRKLILVATPEISMSSLATRLVLYHEVGHLKLGHLTGGGILKDVVKEKEADAYAASMCKVNKIVGRIVILFTIIRNFPYPKDIIISNWKRWV